MALVSLPYPSSNFADGQTAYGTQVDGNITAVTNDYNGNITNANVSATAACG
jgi:hypothetical protein